MLSIMLSQQLLETELTRGALGCPGCGGRLSPWGFARPRDGACGIRWASALDLELGPVTPARSPLGDAVEAIMLAVRARVLRLAARHAEPWEQAVFITGGLLSGLPPPPP
jgi:hypothetical protein